MTGITDSPVYLFILVFIMILCLGVVGFICLKNPNSNHIMKAQGTAIVSNLQTSAIEMSDVDISNDS